MDMNVIRGRQLTGFGVAPEGECVAILRRSLRLRFHDESLRLVYPMGHWEVAGSAVQGGAIVTLETPDGFQVSFSLAALDL